MISKKLTNVTNSIEVHAIEQNEVESAFPQLIKRHGRIKDHVIELELNENVKFTSQKGGRFPIQLQAGVQSEIARLLNEKHLVKVSTGNDKVCSFGQQLSQ